MRRLAAITALLVFPAIAAAQNRRPVAGPEAFGGLGAAWLHDDEGSLGTGLDIGAGAGYRWSGPFAAEVQLGRLATRREFDSGVEFDATLHQVSGRLLHHFSAPNNEPYVGGVAGFTRFDRRSLFPVVVPGAGGRPVRVGDERFRRDGTEFMWGAIAGLRMRTARRVQLRPEFALLVTRPSHFVVLSAGVKIGWGL